MESPNLKMIENPDSKFMLFPNRPILPPKRGEIRKKIFNDLLSSLCSMTRRKKMEGS
ncbi:hypothetical protein RchiOBHm_Chr5g0061741 [Rosa chinensis]|uniref:Uncharacterized protein n=1 Tax=Rosa chinensis TaxID=74649 RepID=A0A2P6QHZ6_ROSCH|nr:hypothetical protein RchiOBHm_Chr5g0061741 [Rosa chinensis]